VAVSVALDAVKFLATSSGTGDFVVSSVSTGYQSFAAAGAVSGSQFSYRAESADRTQWEIGVGIYTSGTSTLTRATVLYNSSGTTSKINFTAAPLVGVVLLAEDIRIREKLTANRTIYVRTDGSDSNDGSANDSSHAFLTLQAAMNAIVSNLDLAGFTVTIQVADGTYTAGVQIKTWTGGGTVIVQGNSSTPANVYFNVTGSNVFDASFGVIPGIFRVKDLKIKTTTSGFHFVSRSPGRLQYTNIVFDAAPALHVVATGSGLIEPYGTNTIIGNAIYHLVVDEGGTINCASADLPAAIGLQTVTGSLTFTSILFAIGHGRMDLTGISFGGGGSVTGKHFDLQDNTFVRVSSPSYKPFGVGSIGGTIVGDAVLVTITAPMVSATKSADYTTRAIDANGSIIHPAADTTARTWTIDSNANVPYPVGTTLTFVNQNAAGTLTITITSDTMRLAGAGTTGNRTLAANGIATAFKLATTEWIINGTGLT
jgi:hypothetical protein